MTKAFTYTLVDTKTKSNIKEYSNRKAASRRADKMNRDYGAHRYTVVFS